LAVYDRTGGEQPLDQDGIVGRDIGAEGGIAPGARQPRDIEGFLHRYRDAMQRPPDFAARERRISSAAALPGLIDLPGDDRVERRVMALGARYVVVEQFETADAAVADLRGEAGR